MMRWSAAHFEALPAILSEKTEWKPKGQIRGRPLSFKIPCFVTLRLTAKNVVFVRKEILFQCVSYSETAWILLSSWWNAVENSKMLCL